MSLALVRVLALSSVGEDCGRKACFSGGGAALPPCIETSRAPAQFTR